eukprot:1149429-Pelagomonas_calceolata.AAC.1
MQGANEDGTKVPKNSICSTCLETGQHHSSPSFHHHSSSPHSCSVKKVHCVGCQSVGLVLEKHEQLLYRTTSTMPNLHYIWISRAVPRWGAHLVFIKIGEHELAVCGVDNRRAAAPASTAGAPIRTAAVAASAPEGPQQDGLGTQHQLLALADGTYFASTHSDQMRDVVQSKREAA